MFSYILDKKILIVLYKDPYIFRYEFLQFYIYNWRLPVNVTYEQSLYLSMIDPEK